MSIRFTLDEFIDGLERAIWSNHRDAENIFVPVDKLTFTFYDMIALAAQAIETLESFSCRLCEQPVWNEYFMVHRKIWDQYGAKNGMLCVGCLESRMGRELVPADFRNCEVNTDTNRSRSERLNNRLGIKV